MDKGQASDRPEYWASEMNILKRIFRRKPRPISAVNWKESQSAQSQVEQHAQVEQHKDAPLIQAENLARWASSTLPERWVTAHLSGWTHLDWLHLLESLRKTQFWPMDEAAIGQHLEMLRPKLRESKIAYLLSVDEPVRPKHPTSEPAYDHLYGAAARRAAEILFQREIEARRLQQEAEHFPSKIRYALLGVPQEDLANLALNAKASTVRIAAAEGIEDQSIAKRVFHEAVDDSVRAQVLPCTGLTQPELMDLALTDSAAAVQLAAISRMGEEALESIASQHPQEPVAISAARLIQDRNRLIKVGRVAAHESVRVFGVEMAKLLGSSGADMNYRDKSGWTPLHLAADHGRKDIVGLLLVNKADINAKKDDGDTPLHCAARRARREVLGLLLANGADVNATNNSGETPLGVALKAHHFSVLELLRQHGARQ
jgi:Ankyrin repeats (3 copies)